MMEYLLLGGMFIVVVISFIILPFLLDCQDSYMAGAYKKGEG